MKVRQLIDIAIGFPEPGHVNFFALHRLLICVVEKLKITDEIVDYHNFEAETLQSFRNTSNCELLNKSRLVGGYNPDEKNGNETPPEPEARTFKKSPSADGTTKKDQPDDFIEQLKDESSISSKTLSTDVVEQTPVIDVLSPKISISTQLSVHKLEERISKMEMMAESNEIPKELVLGISVMKNQLEFVIEQMLLLTYLTLSKNPDFKKIQQLYFMAQTLLEVKKDNIYLEGFKQIQLPSAPPLDWKSSELQLNEDLSENDVLEVQNIDSKSVTMGFQKTNHDQVEDHLCYSPAKLLDQLIELKGELGCLTNKVNELSSLLLEHRSQHSPSHVQEIQDQIQDVKLATVTLKETQSRFEQRLNSNQSNIEDTKRSIEQIFEEKVDKVNFETQLANKVDYNQLQRKISLDQILELQCRIDKKFCDMLQRVNENEKKFTETTEILRNTLGVSAIDEVLKNIKENIAKDIQNLNELLKNHIASTNDESSSH